MATATRPTDDGVAQITGAIGQSNYKGISVDGHCLGIVARTWRDPSAAAGYPYAIDAANAVIKAGAMRTSKPPRGAVIWWDTGGTPGHVATCDKEGSTCGNVGPTIQRKPLDAWSFRRIGWCWPGDVPVWGPAPPPQGKDWYDMATKQDLTDAVRACLTETRYSNPWTGAKTGVVSLIQQADYYAISAALAGTVPNTATSGKNTSTAMATILARLDDMNARLSKLEQAAG